MNVFIDIKNYLVELKALYDKSHTVKLIGDGMTYYKCYW